MFTINEILENEIIIKNSRFITLLFPFNDNDNIDKFLDEVKEKYGKASHYCYSYITENSKKSFDDGEPSGTAGLPILNVLEKNNLVNVLAITVRYFGGIKLGAGGLVRAYSKSVRDTINKEKLIELEDGYLVKIEISYENSKDFDYFTKNYNIINKEFLDNIFYYIEIPLNKINLFDKYNYTIISKKLIKKV